MPDPSEVIKDFGDLHDLENNINSLREKILILEKNPSDKNGVGITECINKFKGIHAKMLELENVWDSENEVAQLFQTTLDNFNMLIMGLENPEKQIHNELEAIVKGVYQDELEAFTVDMGETKEGSRLRKETTNRTKYTVYPMMDKEVFHCTAAIPKKITSYPIEIQINFMGTIDLASKIADLEKGGPGQETLKKYEAELLQKVNNLLSQVAEEYPGAPIQLRIAGQSLGGALAKGFTHTLQRACAVQVDNPLVILDKILDNIVTFESTFESTAAAFAANNNNLLKKLEADAQQFQGLNALKKISGITLYANAAPGVSVQTDKDATLLTYYQAPNFLRVYNHFHKEDIIPKFGDSEFLSGNYGIPQVLVHKAIVYDCELTAKNIVTRDCLPFPGITLRVMEAHYATISFRSNVKTSITNLIECNELKEKFVFSELHRTLYDHVAFVAKSLARSKWFVNKIPFLFSYISQEIPNPNITAPILQRFEPLKFGDQKQRFFKVLEKENKDISVIKPSDNLD